MSELQWTALPPRRRRGEKRARPEETTETETSSAAESTYAERAKDNAARVDDAVAKRSALVRAAPRDLSRSEGAYEHLDHTADVQFHSWGPDLAAAFSALGNCFFDYVTERKAIDADATKAQAFDVEAPDLNALVFRFLDELLFRFSADGVACATVHVSNLQRSDDRYALHVDTTGEIFDLSKHPQGTEVKAITYSNMQVHEKHDRTDIFVIVDI